MGIFSSKKDKIVKNVLRGAFAIGRDVPVSQVDMDSVNNAFNKLSQESRENIIAEVKTDGEQSAIKRYGLQMAATNIMKRVVTLTFSRLYNMPIEELDERMIADVILTFDPAFVLKFATMCIEDGEDVAVENFMQVLKEKEA